jgi:DNA replication licensing factor MCM7
LQNFKSTETEDALGDLRIDGDGTSDEYDFMDDAEDGAQSRRRT